MIKSGVLYLPIGFCSTACLLTPCTIARAMDSPPTMVPLGRRDDDLYWNALRVQF